ncbi:MAG: putative PurR-regulated permease PerM [Cognaticolwellia sp.]|jgi:predicted PurR-regulated permease PerM
MIRRRPSSHSGARPARQRRSRNPLAVTNRERIFWIVGLVLLGLGIVYLLRSLFAILTAAVIVAYLLDPVIDRMQARGLKREPAIALVFCLGVLSSIGILLLVVPMVGGEFAELSTNLNGYIADLGTRAAEGQVWLEDKLGREIPVTGDELLQELVTGLNESEVDDSGSGGGLTDLLTQAAPNLGRWLGSALGAVLSGGVTVFLAVLNWLLLPVFSFYLLRDWDDLIEGADELIPLGQRTMVRDIASRIDQRLSAFVRGQILVAGAQGIIYAIGLLISGIDLAIAVGLGAGVLALVPYLGTIVGISLASALALLKFGLSWHILAVWGTFAFAQVVEGVYLTPKVLGDKVGLHPLVVMLAVVVGGSLFGVGGMLLAIPATAAALVVVEAWLVRYRGSRFFSERKAGNVRAA